MFKKVAALAVSLVATAPVFAAGTGPDLTPLTSNIDFSTVITALLAIAGLLASVYVAIRGSKIVLGMIRGA
ncbi:major capsid protein [Jeongeupia chitinilytica]|uniref:Phage coat protein n=1 Tax=Jeongeupia chitinilytica TaxID=1041641 RepID=A0ABQ3H3U4_9NEIS|nr:major capsid protein [Jeongeupia chitinilytica]GHD66088.1 hypothetical protein GCM10007350_27780 [Jeongeupia chitinilytica]